MNNQEKTIIKLMKVLYDISDKEKNDLEESFTKSSKEEKQEILNLLYNNYRIFEKETKELLMKFKKISNDISEYKEYLNTDEILDNLDY